jgi:hypothetical protein
MAKKAGAKTDSGGKKSARKSTSSRTGRALATSGGSRSGSRSQGEQTDIVDALIKLLQSPLVIDLLAVGATAALAAITETRSSRAQGMVGNSKKTLRSAGKAAAAAVGRRLATEFDEIREASKRAGDERKAGGASGG